MELLIDRSVQKAAVFLTSSDEHGDRRRYYEVGDKLVVVRNGLDLPSLAGAVVDAIIGEDTAVPGFTQHESRVGLKRVKVTIFRLLPAASTRVKKLSELKLNRKRKRRRKR